MKVDPIEEAWKAFNRTPFPKELQRQVTGGSVPGEKRGKGQRFVFSPKAPDPRKR